jgi:hypothetical protein
MYALLSKLAEIIAGFGRSLVADHHSAKDADVAAVIIRCALLLQNLCVHGQRLLVLAERLVDAAATADEVDEFASLFDTQVAAIDSLRANFAETQALLATINFGIYRELVVFLDEKSGLLKCWSKQADSRYSTTTLIFLSAETLDQLVAIGLPGVTIDGWGGERFDYLAAVAQNVQSARRVEVRDLTSPEPISDVPAVKLQIAAAKADLDRAQVCCEQLLNDTRNIVGVDAMARLRRTLSTRSGRG